MFNSFTTTWILSDGYQTALGYPIKPLLHLIRFHHSDAWKPLSHFRLLCHFFVSPISPFNSKHISSKSHPMSWHSVPSPPRSRRGPCLCPRTFWRAEKIISKRNEQWAAIMHNNYHRATEPLSHWATELHMPLDILSMPHTHMNRTSGDTFECPSENRRDSSGSRL